MEKRQDFEYYLKEIEQNFEGWNFSYIQNRYTESVKSWSYHSIIIPYILKSKCLLDMGTGGGEFLSKLPFPKNTFATESYSPNIPIAQAKLEPLGIKVIPLQDGNFDAKLPFNDNQFDLVINRHEYYNPAELSRIIQPKGMFITQQVGNEDCLKINELLGAPYPDDYDQNWTVNFLGEKLKNHGFSILKQLSTIYPSRLFDIGALVYFLKAISWQVSDFSVRKYKEKLYKIHLEIQKTGFIDIPTQRYLLVAIKN